MISFIWGYACMIASFWRNNAISIFFNGLDQAKYLKMSNQRDGSHIPFFSGESDNLHNKL